VFSKLMSSVTVFILPGLIFKIEPSDSWSLVDLLKSQLPNLPFRGHFYFFVERVINLGSLPASLHSVGIEI